MSTPGYEIGDPASLSTHASRVSGVSEMIREANTAGQDADGITRALADYDTIEQQIKARNDELGWTS